MAADPANPRNASDAFSLAARLRSLDDTRLAAVIRTREIRLGSIKDFFDLAEALLERASVQQQLTRLDRGVLAAIAATAENPASSSSTADIIALLGAYGEAPRAADVDSRLQAAARLLLVDTEDDGADSSGCQGGSDSQDSRESQCRRGRIRIYDRVADQLRSWPAAGLPGLAELAAGPPLAALPPVSHTDARFVDRVASEHAFSAATEITELLVELEREPARELAKGGIALPDTKRLASAMAVDLERVARLLAIADHAGLVAREAGALLITDAGGAWLLKPSDERWRILAAGWLRQLPPDIRGLLRERSHTLWGIGLRRFVEWLYPAAGEWVQERIATYTQAAELLGITANHEPSSPGSVLLVSGQDAAAHEMAALLPREVEKVYLQHDLSVVAPGPLTPRIDYRLRAIADVESRALASSYRVSASSMNRAMAAGETADSVRSFLSAISLSGIPQPLGYLITETARRYGLVRVGEARGLEAEFPDAGFRTYVRSDDAALLGTVAVDQNLSALGFTSIDKHRLATRVAFDTVFWNLSDARYPVAAEDGSGEVIALQRRRHARSAPAIDRDPVADLIERLRLGSETEPGEAEDAWLARQLDAAIRAKAALTVSVTMPNGAVVDYQLEPTSIAGGRLRARDQRSAIERTLPLSSITGISPGTGE